jgi:hypothetical protein
MQIRQFVADAIPVFAKGVLELVASYAHQDVDHLTDNDFETRVLHKHRMDTVVALKKELEHQSFSVQTYSGISQFDSNLFWYEYDFDRRVAVFAPWMRHLGFPYPTVDRSDGRTDRMSAKIYVSNSIIRDCRETTAVFEDGATLSFVDGVSETGLTLDHLSDEDNLLVVRTCDLLSSSSSRKRKRAPALRASGADMDDLLPP